MAGKKAASKKPRRKADPDDTASKFVSDPQIIEFGARLRAAREAAEPRLTLRALSDMTRIHYGDISKIERGMINAKYGTLRRLAQAVGMTVGLDLLPAPPRKKPHPPKS